MSKEFLSPFQLMQSSIEHVSFDVIDTTLDISSASVSLGHCFADDEFRKDGIWAIKGDLSVECEWQSDEGDVVCKGTCDLWGAVSVFEAAFDDECAESELGILLRANMISLLYAEARSIIELLSSNTKAGKKILPSISPFDYLAADEDDGEAESRK